MPVAECFINRNFGNLRSESALREHERKWKDLDK